ncbi:PglL family O-oligosaccharyltransferase [Aliivibrio fischeri]|uniref:Ligase n=1 Tax=Aliivibrio fischeri TaxID=668 RepID=A0A510UIL5_ALIFS|nr:PglL family O-oligosaccharyltransferase [Aliivibrio fischeri]GEK14478.1 ligase [Aliivibrio fischeri]
MATLLTQGTLLEAKKIKKPLTKSFLLSLTILFFFCAHFFQPNPGGSGLHLAFNAASWIPASIAIAIALFHIAKQGILKFSTLSIVLFISVCLLSIPLLYQEASPHLATGKFLGLWAGLLFFITLQQFSFSNKQKQWLLWCIIGSVLIETLFGYIQYLFLEAGNSFGYNVIANRPYGIFQQPNVMASFLVTGLAIASYFLARQPIKYRENIIALTLLYATIIFTLPLIAVLASRTGWLSATFSLVLLVPYMWKYCTKPRFISWLLALVIGFSGSFALLDVSKNDDISKVSLASQKADLDSPRRYTFPQALDMFLEKPVTGYGYGNFEAEYILYTAKQHQLSSDYKPGLPSMDHPHNEILYWGVEGGIVAILGLLLAAGGVLAKIRRSKLDTQFALLALIAPIFIHSQLEYPFYHSMIHWFTFIILLFWIDQLSCKYKKYRISDISKITLRVSSLVLPIVTGFYMLSTLHTNWVLTQFETTKPMNPEILSRVTNPVVWEDRFNWDVLSTQLKIGIINKKPELIKPYIEWSQELIKTKPRPAFYQNLIIAYQALGDEKRAEDIRREAIYLFPKSKFESVQLDEKLRMPN